MVQALPGVAWALGLVLAGGAVRAEVPLTLRMPGGLNGASLHERYERAAWDDRVPWLAGLVPFAQARPLPQELPTQARLGVTRLGEVPAAGAGQLHSIGQAVLRQLGRGGTGSAELWMPVWERPEAQTLLAALRGHTGALLAFAAFPRDAALAAAPAESRAPFGMSLGLAALLAALGVVLALILRAREAAQRELAQSRATLEAAIEALPIGFVMWDAADRLVVCNSAYRDHYRLSAPFIRPGATFEEIVRQGAEVGQYRLQEGEDREAFLRSVVAWHRSGQPPFERALPDGRWIQVAEKAMPAGGIVGTRVDITELRLGLEEMARLRDAADAARAAKSRMVAHVSHELRSPLSGLLHLADAAQADPALSPAQARRAAQMGAAARHVLAIANEVLDLAALEAGALTFTEEPVCPRALAEEALDMLRPVAESRDVRLSVSAPMLPARILADPVRLRQVLLNLLGNAVRHGPPGSEVALRLSAVGGALRIEVADEGPGVPEPDRPRVFADFVRLSGEGAGLGLAISATIVGRLGGRIGCADNPAGAGALFWAEIPLREAAAEVAPPTLPSLRLLAVDDAPANLSVLRALLDGAGCRLDAVTEGAAGLELLRVAAMDGDPYDLVLMDVMMPGMDGFETTRRLRALPGMLGRTPVLAVTAGTFAEDVAACRAAGMAGHIAKPVGRVALFDAIASAVPRRAVLAGTSVGASALRPEFLCEVRARLAVLEDPAAGSEGKAEAAHALVSAAGGLSLPELAEEARAAMQALRAHAGDAEARTACLAARLREALPDLAA